MPITEPDANTPVSELEDVEHSKETIEDLDAPEETADEARGGAASKSNGPEC